MTVRASLWAFRCTLAADRWRLKLEALEERWLGNVGAGRPSVGVACRLYPEVARHLEFLRGLGAARMSGSGAFSIISTHVLGNVLGPVFVYATGILSVSMILASGLSFLGLGTPAPYASWGRMLQASQPYLATDPHLALWPGLAIAVIRAESNFDPQAVSPKNAQGLMQLIPETAARFNVKQPLDPEQNIRGGLAYLRWLLAYFKGDVPLAVAAYNAGEGAVDRHRGVPPYPETQGYVRRILEVFNVHSHPFDARITAPSPELPRIAQRPRS